MRAPRRLLRDLGPAGFVVFHLLVGGSVFAALMHPFFLLTLLYEIAGAQTGSAAAAKLASLHGATLLIGYLASTMLALIGLAHRRLLQSAWVLLLMPLYWLLLSVAAWRALHQLLHDPYRWEKTEHGLARSSRMRHETGEFAHGVRDISAARSRRPRDGA
jgi:hypothetical protein